MLLKLWLGHSYPYIFGLFWYSIRCIDWVSIKGGFFFKPLNPKGFGSFLINMLPTFAEPEVFIRSYYSQIIAF